MASKFIGSDFQINVDDGIGHAFVRRLGRCTRRRLASPDQADHRGLS
jgi:hypothetical protein